KSFPDDFIFVGGSTFVVGDLLSSYATPLSI
ncbi:Bifunctional protein FolC, partial [termite gut metagenome]